MARTDVLASSPPSSPESGHSGGDADGVCGRGNGYDRALGQETSDAVCGARGNRRHVRPSPTVSLHKRPRRPPQTRAKPGSERVFPPPNTPDETVSPLETQGIDADGVVDECATERSRCKRGAQDRDEPRVAASPSLACHSDTPWIISDIETARLRVRAPHQLGAGLMFHRVLSAPERPLGVGNACTDHARRVHKLWTLFCSFQHSAALSTSPLLSAPPLLLRSAPLLLPYRPPLRRHRPPRRSLQPSGPLPSAPSFALRFLARSLTFHLPGSFVRSARFTSRLRPKSI